MMMYFLKLLKDITTRLNSFNLSALEFVPYQFALPYLLARNRQPAPAQGQSRAQRDATLGRES